MWPMGLLFLKTSPVKQYSYEKYFSGVFDALHQSCLCSFVMVRLSGVRRTILTFGYDVFMCADVSYDG